MRGDTFGDGTKQTDNKLSPACCEVLVNSYVLMHRNKSERLFTNFVSLMTQQNKLKWLVFPVHISSLI